MFQPDLWLIYESVLNKIPRTTNCLETAIVGIRHLSIKRLADEIRREQHQIEGFILGTLANESLNTESFQKIDKMIYEKVKIANQLSNIDFIEGVASSLTDKRNKK